MCLSVSVLIPLMSVRLLWVLNVALLLFSSADIMRLSLPPFMFLFFPHVIVFLTFLLGGGGGGGG